MSSLPPPELNKRRSEHEGTPSGPMSSGSRKAKDRESTFEGKGPANVYRLVTTHSQRVFGQEHKPFGQPKPAEPECDGLRQSICTALYFHSLVRQRKSQISEVDFGPLGFCL